MALVSNPKDGDNVSVRQAIARLGSSKLGPTSTPTFAEVTTGTLTISGLDASEFVFTDASKTLTSVNVPLTVPYGGTGVTSLTDHSILLGSAVDVVTALGLAANGQIPIGFQNSDPVLANITATANQITVTNGAGTIALSLPNPLAIPGKLTAGSFGSPTDVTNTRKYGFELHYSGNDYDVFGIRSRANLITTANSSTRTATGAELQAANSNGISVNVLCGAKCSSTGKSTSSSATISYMRAVDLITEWGAKDTVTNLYNTHIKCITRNAAGEGSFGIGYGIYLENIAVGGTGQALDAGIYFKETSFATDSFVYGIDFTGATYDKGDINLSADPMIRSDGERVIHFNHDQKGCFVGEDTTDGDIGDENCFIGYQAGKKNDATTISIPEATGTKNTYIGARAGQGDSGADNEGAENTGVGCEALRDNSTGYENTALGDEALRRNTTGHGNCALGNDALELNINGNFNSAFGTDSLYVNVDGSYNISVGYQCLYQSTSDDYNIGVGYQSGYTLNGGNSNVYVGYQAGYKETTTNNQIFIGYQAGYNDNGDPTVGENVFVGYQCFYNDSGQYNVGFGYEAGRNNDATVFEDFGDKNTYIGYQAGKGAVGNSGFDNVAIGYQTLTKITNAVRCMALGARALYSTTTGDRLVGLGYSSFYSNTTGNDNVGIGEGAAYYTQTGNRNTIIGAGAGFGVYQNSYSDNIFIGYRAGFRQATNSNLLIIDNQQRADVATELTNAIIYGVMAAAPADQSLRINADVGIGITPTSGLKMGDDKLVAFDVNAGLTASTTQSQGQGALTAQINEISTVANKDDTVTLPSAVTGIEIEIINNGVNTLQIFPASGDDLGLGVNTAEELEANERVRFVAYDTTNWAKESSTEIIHAEIHDEDNTDAFVINDAGGDFHSYHTNGLAAGDLADWAFDTGGAGTSFPIASIADGADSGVDIAVTTTGLHGLEVGDIISQTNLADAAYVGIFEVKAIISTTIYEVAAVYTATGTGTMDQAATLEPDAVAAGVYSFAYCISATPVGNNETFDFQLYKEATAITGSKIRRKFGAANDFGSMSGCGVVAVNSGDKLSLALSNEDSAANLIIRNLTIVLIRL